MKTKISLIAGLALAVSAIALSGQTGAAWPALEPGQGRFLTSEQRVARQQQMQTTVANLRAKKTAGTLTAEEQAWLDQAEKQGGWCINGIPRGRGWGAQAGAGFGPGRGRGWGRGANGCPFATPPSSVPGN